MAWDGIAIFLSKECFLFSKIENDSTLIFLVNNFSFRWFPVLWGETADTKTIIHLEKSNRGPNHIAVFVKVGLCKAKKRASIG
jgi:hypothetical protein